MHTGSCHCGAVRLVLPRTPEAATDCNCSLCRRIGGRWVYFALGEVRIEHEPDALAAYEWGDRTLRTMRCRTCGSVTHWEPLDAAGTPRHGVNLNNFDPQLIASVPVRRFDGADTWTYLDDPAPAATAQELAATVARMEARLLHSPSAGACAYRALAARFEADLAPSQRDIALAKSSALMLVQALADGAVDPPQTTAARND